MQNTNPPGTLVVVAVLLLTAAVVLGQGAIILEQPLSRQFPLAAKVTAWYRVVPALAGGRTWYSSAGYQHGTLTNMAASGTSGWNSTTRPGGEGEMRFSGSGYVLLGNPVQLQVTTGAWSACLWVRSTAAPPGTPNDAMAPGVLALTDNGTGVTRALDMSLLPDEWGAEAGKMVLEAYDGTNNPSLFSDAVIVNTGWQHFCGVRGNSQLRLFQNGIEAASSPITDTTGSINAAGLAWAIGARLDSNFGWPFTGMVDDVMIFNGTALTPNDVRLIYQDSRQGNLLALHRYESLDIPLVSGPRAVRKRVLSE